MQNFLSMNPYREQAHLLKLLAHPMRLQILDVLRRESECVCHLSAVLDKPQPYVSQQLAVLRNAGLIDDDREGTNVYYRLADPHLASLLAAVLEAAHDDGARVTTIKDGPVAGCICPKCQAQ